MGIYFNPSGASFRGDISGRIYVEKTGLLEILNGVLGTSDRCIALSHARRFGKSQAAGMIDAYYSKGCDSHDLFAPFEIAKSPDFEKHLNKYNVIHLDISSVADFHKEDLVDTILSCLQDELREAYPDIDYVHGAVLTKEAFGKLPVVGPFILTFGIVTFSLSTILGWYYYGEKAVEYLSRGRRLVKWFKMLWIAGILIGAVANLTVVWDIADCMNALMAIPNLVSLILLSGVIAKETNKWLWKRKTND